MTPGARIAAAIEVLADIEGRRRPAVDALKDWGLSHRFAGSGDRAAIADRVYDALRCRASNAWATGDDGARMAVLASALAEECAAETARGAWAGDRHAPQLTDAELAALSLSARAQRLVDAPAWVCGDYPQWLDPPLAEAFGEARAEETKALAERPPTDLRANTLAIDREALLAAFRDKAESEAVVPGRWSPTCVRLEPELDVRRLAPTATPQFLRGDFEIQDEGSQLVGLFAGARPGMQVGDLCAGGGGKTLALAALMANTGQVFAYDIDARRLAKADARLKRAGVRNAQLRFPGRGALDDIEGRLDLALVDAPCSGSGTWRRNPDAKWRLRPNALDQRRREQGEALALAARMVRPGGRIAYATCSVLPSENDGAVAAFLAAHQGFQSLPAAEAVRAAMPESALVFLAAAMPTTCGLQMTPRRTGTDGFYFALIERSA